ncbi:hypothetical protein PR202_ga17769 [Eleusine coracana subsp. coracana]|uniref:EF-hand domain-containing protein n=1 Tax=Eleusine coracana subsp. coracana TaxID=191504 RepID=A0AAV5CP43_ELECO|nr:hypothetical protein PR202_ga17522 [Eleusine coracana subsp. coracana]GJN00577.1 hypothetical protein PR202_ga17769 [Eleusine coracana subsp. coracana]
MRYRGLPQGEVTVEEFRAWLSQFDTDRDGRISREELQTERAAEPERVVLVVEGARRGESSRCQTATAPWAGTGVASKALHLRRGISTSRSHRHSSG